jgi:Cft2 family RNA processing exonuclease
VKCDTFVTESTFGLPIYRWRAHAEMFSEINQWWAANAEAGRASVLFGYSFGKAQRMLKSVDAHMITLARSWSHRRRLLDRLGSSDLANIPMHSRLAGWRFAVLKSSAMWIVVL